ncbi:fasciclin domain-containing protein, partial [Yoonia sp.]
ATVNGADVHIDGRNGVKVEDINVTTADIIASNGVIHVIDAVLLP